MKIFPKSLAGFGIIVYLCTANKTMVVHPSGRTSDAQLVSAGHFFCHQSIYS